ncbi:SAM-dependent methyltransferase [Sphaerisporangium aureirubrum]|uniref:SAM-dependent methyltransferase n=1 Tax=Sphaerisporangium aureirubrum TaxID=1544736 RepID=A0ABW1NTY8_9ACTN
MGEGVRREPGDLDVTTPNWARIGNYILGGKDHFAADRAAAEEILFYAPEIRPMTVELYDFQARAIRYLASQGTDQYIVIGTGLPSTCQTHAVARAIVPGARVVYVSHDAVVLSHARALVATDADTGVVKGHVLHPADIVADPVTRRYIDPDRPVGVIIPNILQYIPDVDDPFKRVGELRDWMPPGSHLVLAHVVLDSRPAAADRIVQVYKRIIGRDEDASRTRDQVRGFFDGLEMVEPGLVYIREWRPDNPLATHRPEKLWMVGGVGRKAPN